MRSHSNSHGALLEEPDSPPAPAIDMIAFHAKFYGDAGYVRELWQTYVQSTRAHLSALEQALTRGDRESFRLHAHSIKGASANLCAHGVRDLSTTLEVESADAPLTLLSVHLSQLRQIFKTACQNFEPPVP